MGCTYSKKNAKSCSEDSPFKVLNICDRPKEYSSQQHIDTQLPLSVSVSPSSHTSPPTKLNITEPLFNSTTQNMLPTKNPHVPYGNGAFNHNKTSSETERTSLTVPLQVGFQTIFPTKDRKMEKESRSKNRVLHPFWDQADHEYIIRNNIQRDHRHLNALQERDETDDTLYEIPMRMPEIDFT